MCQEIEFKPYSRIRDPQNIKHLYKLFEFFLPKMGLNLIRKGFICVVTIICFQTIIVTGDNLCNLCKCLNDGTYYMDIKCMNNFDMIYGYLQWPRTRRKIETYFVNLTKFPNFPYSDRVFKLCVKNSVLKDVHPEIVLPFPNLERLEFSNTNMTHIPPVLVNNSRRITHLNLSKNFLNNAQIENLSNIDKLIEIDLSYNQLTKFSQRLMLLLKNIKYLNFEGNEITGFNNSQKYHTYHWRDLNLSRNKIAYITTVVFSKLSQLEYINLSHNIILFVARNVFKNFEKLKKIDLSHNHLKILSLELPDSVSIIRMNNNYVRSWPFIKLPKHLTELHIQNNKFRHLLLDTTDHLPYLRMVNASGNKLTFFPIVELFQLRYLDLSNNELTTVPQNMWFIAPILEILVLDYNPIVMVKFGRTFLTQLSMSHMPRLTNLEANSFSQIEGTQVNIRRRHETCVDISITHCPLLSVIDAKAFGKTVLCSLDLRYNNLSSVSRKLTDWSKLESPINVDGNPGTVWAQ